MLSGKVCIYWWVYIIIGYRGQYASLVIEDSPVTHTHHTHTHTHTHTHYYDLTPASTRFLAVEGRSFIYKGSGR